MSEKLLGEVHRDLYMPHPDDYFRLQYDRYEKQALCFQY